MSLSRPPHTLAPAIGPERYSIVDTLGRGASGDVFLAFDAETGGHVALKKLLRLDQHSVQRFKREFRSLADVHHPNLVKLFDLQRGSDAWLLTMEYVEGSEFLEHLRTGDGALSPRLLAEVLRVFHSLASGVHALHRAGLLHRDLKPSNVLIARDGRVVVLDFGLVHELSQGEELLTQDGMIAGTPAYMAPEQVRGERLTEATDWYAFGAMLYQVLSGHLPFEERSVMELLQHKLEHDPAALDAQKLGVPAELTELCVRLVSRDPAQRPGGVEVRAALDGLRGVPAAENTTRSEELSVFPEPDVQRSSGRAPLIGRESALGQLTAAFDAACLGRSVAVSVCGNSGAGKTALIEHFLAEAERGGRHPLVLRSRCYERESIPFKALDGAMDALVHYLSKLDELDASHLLPSGLVDFTQLFPAFQRLRSVQRLLLLSKPHPDAAETLQRAVQGLRDLFDRIAHRRPVILWIDDLQWGDLDSASVLRDWFAQPRAAPLLLISSYRSEELHTSACLRALGSVLVDAELIELTPLAETDVKTLCEQRMKSDAPPEVVSRIISEARGNPFWALQLSALAQANLGRAELNLDDVSISGLVTRASALLPPAARSLLNVLAIAGRPLAPHLALQAAEVGRDGRSTIHSLQSLRLVRSPVVNGERLLEVYHDRVREAVHAALDIETRRSVHDQLLRVLEVSSRADADWLHDLALGAGEHAVALRYGLIAAERAQNTLAFERAIELYQRCLQLTADRAEQAKLWSKLGSVFARSRRGAQAADAYLAAAERVPENEKLPLQQLAASHLLRTGRFEEGEQLVQAVLAAQDIHVPKTEAGLYAAIGWERVRLALRGSSFQHDPDAISPERSRLCILYGILGVETQFYAPVRSALFQARSLRLAIANGDALLVARSLCAEAAVSCLAGDERASRRADAVLDRAALIASQVENQDVSSELYTARTVCAFLTGRMEVALEMSEKANHIYETQRSGGEEGDYYYLFAAHCARIGALQVLGRHKQADQELREMLARAEATANRTAILQFTLVRTASELYRDRAHEARPRLDRERDELPKHGIGILHLLHLGAVFRAASQSFEFDWALAVSDQLWKPCMRSPLRHGRMLRFILHSTRARMLLNRFVVQGRRGDPAEVVHEDLRALRAIDDLPSQSLARSLSARIAYLRGEVASARETVRSVQRDFAERALLDQAAEEKYALGYLTGGEEGTQLRAAAHAESLALGTANPYALLRSSYPELLLDYDPAHFGATDS